ncbi:hypothetical protein Q8F55_006130 [Vanrija albida]|uniref:Ig-like domain-containing protein n=1 Tax=Vanrija albida TaxID=181172 RepID=A0ABR3PWM4_9TREE
MKFTTVLLALAAAANAAPVADPDTAALEDREWVQQPFGVSLNQDGWCFSSLWSPGGKLMKDGDRFTITCRVTGREIRGENDYFLTTYGCFLIRPTVLASQYALDHLPVCGA